MPKVAIVGAGGLVGKRLVSRFERTPISGLELIVTGREKSVGTRIPYNDQWLTVEKTSLPKLRSADIVVLCTPAGASRELVQELRGGPVILDTSSAFRMDDKIPLAVPEVNPEALLNHQGLIAGPNCSTIQLVMVLKPLYSRYGLKRVRVATYQAVSGVGYQAVRQLEEEASHKLFPEKPDYEGEPQFPHPMAFNLIPQVDTFLPDGYTKEEMKMVNETRKIMGLPKLPISCTCVRVPVFVGHSEECMVETDTKSDLDDVREVLKHAPGVIVLDDFKNQQYPMPLTAEDTDDVYVGRIRHDISAKPDGAGLLLWIVADNLLRGAATNAFNVVRLLLGA